MKWLRFAVQRIDDFNSGIAKTVCWIVIITMLTTVYDVVMRYFFDAPTVWAYELGGLLLAPFWLLAGGLRSFTKRPCPYGCVLSAPSSQEAGYSGPGYLHAFLLLL